MIKHQFSDFSYAVNKDSAKKGHKEVLVCFMYNGTEVLKKVYIPEKAGTAYIFEAKQIIDKEMRDGSLAAYAHKFVGRKNKEAAKPKAAPSSGNKTEYVPLPPKKGLKIAFVVVCVLLAGAVAVALLLFLKKQPDTPTPTVNQVAVTFDAGEGSWEDKSHAKTYTVDKGKTWADITKPEEDPKIESEDFTGWTINGEDPKSYVFNTNTTVVANYKKKTFDLTFGCGSGTWADLKEAEYRVIENVTYGTTWEKLLQEHKGELAVEAPNGYVHTGFSAEGEPLLTNYYPFTTLDTKKQFIAQYEPKDPTEVMVTIDPGEGTWPGGSHDIKTVSATIGETTWNELLKNNPVATPSGYKNEPTWEYCNMTTDKQWEPIPEEGLTITEATDFKATFEPREDIYLEIGPNGGTWVEPTGSTDPKRIENITYGTTWEEIKAENDLRIEAPTGKNFVYFAVGEGADAQPATNSYVINDNDYIGAVYVNSSEAKQINLNAGNYGTFAGQSTAVIHVPYGKTWGDVKAAFTPSLKDEFKDLKEFDYFTYHDATSGEDVQLPDSTVIDANTPSTLTAHYADVIASDFANDSWAVIKREADKGVDSFNDVYNNPLGQIRTVELFGNTYNVKLIGMGHDDLVDNGKATLTFEFEQVITKGIGYINYDDAYGEYDTSNIRTYLNNMVYNSLPDDLRSAISTVKKSTYEYDTTSVTVTNDNLFPLSLSEMGYAQDPRGTAVQNEGTAYSGRATLPVMKSNTPFWTRSPAPANPFAAWAIDQNGILGLPGSMYDHEASEMTLGLGVAPAFCIGEVAE